MKPHKLFLLLFGLLLVSGLQLGAGANTKAFAAPSARTLAAGEQSYTVQAGDSLYGIAGRFNVPVDDLVAANNITNRNLIYVGQTLIIPARGVPVTTPSNTPATQPTGDVTVGAGTVVEYTVQAGDTLYGIALKYNTTVDAIRAYNNIDNQNVIFAGTVLKIVAGDQITQPVDTTPAAPVVSAPVSDDSTTYKWIDVNLSTQSMNAYEGDTAVYSSLVSTGVANHPTPPGVYHIYSKLRYDDMAGGYGAEAYYLPDVPYVMYFLEGGYALHGTYWHHNFGQPMSHGCVNLPTDVAGWLYNWAPNGTTVNIHW